MKKLFVLTVLWFLTTLPGYSQGLLYFSEQESDADDNPVWFTPGSYQGNVHSNGAFHFREPQLFGEMLSSSADTFELGEDVDIDDIERPYGHLFNLREIELADSFHWDREGVLYNANGHDGRFITRIKFQEDQGIEIHQYPTGVEYRDSIIWISGPRAQGSFYVDGDAEITGTIMGIITVYCTGDLWLVDDIRYSGSNIESGRFGLEPEIMQLMPHMLYLVSEKNIIIADTDENGKENGWDDGENDIDRHSIIIDAAMYALGGSFTFQHQNYDHERYQGPEPDERGIIHLTGCIYQKYGSVLHNDNHGGTGYQVDYLYDYRLDRNSDPNGLIESEWTYINPYFTTLNLDSTQGIVYKAIIGDRLIAGPGSEITFAEHGSLICRHLLRLEGSMHSQVVISSLYQNTGSIIMDWSDDRRFHLKNVIVVDPVEIDFNVDSSSTIDSCVFEHPITLSGGNIEINKSEFNSGVNLNTDNIVISNSTILGISRIAANLKLFQSNVTGTIEPFYENNDWYAGGSFEAYNSNFDCEEIWLNHIELVIDSCKFTGPNNSLIYNFLDFFPIDTRMYCSISNSVFNVYLTWAIIEGRIKVFNNVFLGGVNLSNGSQEIYTFATEITNNTFVNAPRAALSLSTASDVIFRNNIVNNCNGGLYMSRNNEEIYLEYNNVYQNMRNGHVENYYGCEPGEGSFSADPRFLDPDNADFNLHPDSPCIDAGDPDSPLDPDGSRADMGAFPYNHNVSVNNETDPTVPSTYGFSAYPNPFNSSTTLTYSLPEQASVNITIFDLSGRQVAVLAAGQQLAGVYSVTWNGTSIPSGIYMAVVKAGEYADTRKLVLMR